LKIAFWSNSRGNSGVTSNLACISVASAMEYSHKSILIENHYQKNKLENVLMYNRANYHSREEANNQFKHIGMDYFINQLSTGRYEVPMGNSTSNVMKDTSNVVKDTSNVMKDTSNVMKDTSNVMKDTSNVMKDTSNVMKDTSQVIKNSSLEILSNSLYFIPPSYVTNRETFEYNLYGNINRILEALDAFADIIYIDTSNKNNLSSKIILAEVDLVVVNLNQNSSMIKSFFDDYSSILSKCVFLISSYHKESSLNINKISKNHLINRANIATIPYNVEYQEAVSQGTVVEFLSRNYACKRTNPNYNFVHEVKNAVYMIYRNLGLISQKEKCL